MILYLDLETYNEAPITVGTHKYAETAEVLLVAYAIDDAPAVVWDRTNRIDMPHELAYALLFLKTVVIHNSHFDRTILRHALGINIATSKIHDTMIQALSHSLPAGLGDLCAVLGISADKAKDKDGKKLINLFCKPQAANRIVRRADRDTHPDEWARFIDYARLDVEAMREVKNKMPVLNMTDIEHKLWELDQKINDRGFLVDMDLAVGALTAVGIAQVGLAEKSMELTDGELESTTKTVAFRLKLFEMFGVDMPDMRKSTVENAINDPSTPAGMVTLLQVRQQASTTSTAKYKVLQRAVSTDNRLRGTLQFNGASRTGRWAGRLFQPQNLMRPTMAHEDIEFAIAAIKAGCLHLTHDNPMSVIANCTRAAIIAPGGKKLVIADLANIEGRVQCWLAGETWKLAAFREYDAGVGPDLYKLAYAKSFNSDAKDVTKDQRQIGKVMELALAYHGGVGAFETFALAYGIDLEALADKVLQNAPAELIEQADRWLVMFKKNNGGRGFSSMSDDAFVACDVLKRAWRLAHPAIVAYWNKLTDAITQALAHRGEVVHELGLAFRVSKTGSWLTIRMQSGRVLCYPSPKMSDEGLSYMGQNQLTRKWERIRTYSGKIYENLCQSIARDVMASAMQTIDDSGYLITLSVHDELITECPDLPEYNSEHLSKMMSAPPSWAPDMPLAAAGFETYRYRKD